MKTGTKIALWLLALWLLAEAEEEEKREEAQDLYDEIEDKAGDDLEKGRGRRRKPDPEKRSRFLKAVIHSSSLTVWKRLITLMHGAARVITGSLSRRWAITCWWKTER